MENKEDQVNILTLAPMTEYNVPELPTYEADKPDFTSKLPYRWKSKAIAAIATGILGINVLSGCSIFEQVIPEACGVDEWWAELSNFRYDLCVRLHHGGAGVAVYVAHLTEQEVFGIIKDRLAAASLEFNDEPPEHDVDIWGFFEQDTAIDLFNSQDNIGIIHLSWAGSNMPFSSRGRDASQMVANAFSEQAPDINIGVFNTPGQRLRDENWNEIRLTRSNAVDIRANLLENLDEQLQEFLDQLQEAGVID